VVTSRFELYYTRTIGAPDHRGCAGEGMKCLCSLEHWERGFQSHSRRGCLSVYSVFVLGSGLTPDSRTPTNCLRLRK
jgi:hypothetical protein